MTTNGPEKRALRCEEARVLLMGFIDGELDIASARRLEDHLSVCVACRHEEMSYRSLGDLTEAGLHEGDGNVNTQEAWESIYARLERRVGWTLFWIGFLVLAGFGAWQFVGEFLLDPEAPVALRIGVATIVGGSLMLLVSFLRETLGRQKTERYREVQR